MRANLDPDVFQIIFAGGVGVIVMVFTQYSVGMGICLDLDKTEAPTLDLLTVDLPFMHHLFHIMTFPPSCIARTAKCLAC
jgi:hypothetical protein